MRKWHGPYDNPIRAVMGCLEAEDFDNSEFMMFGLYEVAISIQVTTIENFFDDLCDGIQHRVGVELKFDSVGQGWYAKYVGDY